MFLWKDLLWEAIDVSWSVRSRWWGNCVSIVKRPQWEAMCLMWSVRSCRSVRSSGGLVLQWGAEPLRQIWVQWEHPSEGDLFCGCRLRPNHVRSCVCDCDCCWHWSACCVVGSLPGWLRFPETDAGKSWGVVVLLFATGCYRLIQHLASKKSFEWSLIHPPFQCPKNFNLY